MKLSEYVMQVINDPKYGHDIEWVRGNLHRAHIEAIEAAHDAEVRASVVSEEPEWEVGVSYSTSSGPSIDGYRVRSYMKVESVEKAREFAALVERPMIQKRTKAIPAGEWISVPVEQKGTEQ